MEGEEVTLVQYLVEVSIVVVSTTSITLAEEVEAVVIGEAEVGVGVVETTAADLAFLEIVQQVILYA